MSSCSGSSTSLCPSSGSSHAELDDVLNESQDDTNSKRRGIKRNSSGSSSSHYSTEEEDKYSYRPHESRFDRLNEVELLVNVTDSTMTSAQSAIAAMRACFVRDAHVELAAQVAERDAMREHVAEQTRRLQEMTRDVYRLSHGHAEEGMDAEEFAVRLTGNVVQYARVMNLREGAVFSSAMGQAGSAGAETETSVARVKDERTRQSSGRVVKTRTGKTARGVANNSKDSNSSKNNNKSATGRRNKTRASGKRAGQNRSSNSASKNKSVSTSNSTKTKNTGDENTNATCIDNNIESSQTQGMPHHDTDAATHEFTDDTSHMSGRVDKKNSRQGGHARDMTSSLADAVPSTFSSFPAHSSSSYTGSALSSLFATSATAVAAAGNEEIAEAKTTLCAGDYVTAFVKGRPETAEVGCQVTEADLGYVNSAMSAVMFTTNELLAQEKKLLHALRLAIVALATIVIFHASLEVESTCPACYCILEHPRTLWPCGHTFCQRCLISMYITHEDLVCAVCGTQCGLGYSPNRSAELIAHYQVVRRQSGSSTVDAQTVEGVLRHLLEELLSVQQTFYDGYRV